MKNVWRILIVVFALSTLPALNGCGIKPDHVDPPQGEKDDIFPRTYPDPATDAQL
jgi:predicted small lipoprotein YifL